MQEIQFVADAVLNLLNGLSDYSSAKLDAIYKTHEETFPGVRTVKQRLDRCFTVIASIPKHVITSTIFRRQPLFFSLILAIDAKRATPRPKKLEHALQEIDDRFNSETPVTERPASDAEFYEACRASTQRIKNRKIRDQYIKRFLK